MLLIGLEGQLGPLGNQSRSDFRDRKPRPQADLLEPIKHLLRHLKINALGKLFGIQLPIHHEAKTSTGLVLHIAAPLASLARELAKAKRGETKTDGTESQGRGPECGEMLQRQRGALHEANGSRQ